MPGGATRRVLRMVTVLATLGVGAGVGCTGERSPGAAATPADEAPADPTPADAVSADMAPVEAAPVDVERAARAIVELLRDRDFEALAGLVDPATGVRFSPYAYVEPDRDRTLSAAELEAGATDPTIRHWGELDGSGDLIDMTIRQYFDRFVYDVDFANAEEVGYDREIGRGNTINNAVEVYPQSTIVEFHFSGFNPDFDGMDWRSLRLVLRPVGGAWYLEGIIHDQWTI
jgi:hypothetical protein